MDKVKTFRSSRRWRDFAHLLKVERGFRCARSGRVYAGAAELVAHHTVELTEDNVDDPGISLNPALIEVISADEHNKEHRRFGYGGHEAYIIFGSPLSGKTTLAREMMGPGDIALDIDWLHGAITLGGPRKSRDPDDSLKFNLYGLRDCLLDQIRRRYGGWRDAYIIGGYPRAADRERLARSLKAELIYCDSAEEECVRRFHESGRPSEWLGYISAWWRDADIPVRDKPPG